MYTQYARDANDHEHAQASKLKSMVELKNVVAWVWYYAQKERLCEILIEIKEKYCTLINHYFVSINLLDQLNISQVDLISFRLTVFVVRCIK